ARNGGVLEVVEVRDAELVAALHAVLSNALGLGHRRGARRVVGHDREKVVVGTSSAARIVADEVPQLRSLLRDGVLDGRRRVKLLQKRRAGGGIRAGCHGSTL